MLNFVYLRSSGLHFFFTFFDFHALSTRGEFEHVLVCCMHLEGFQVVSSYF
jgi:hypothetical protein